MLKRKISFILAFCNHLNNKGSEGYEGKKCFVFHLLETYFLSFRSFYSYCFLN